MTGMTQYLPVLSRFRARVEILADEAQTLVCQRTDRMFAGLLLFQWLIQIVLATVYAPRAWADLSSAPQAHAPTALFVGGAIVALPKLTGAVP